MTTPTGSAGLGAAPVVARWGTGHPSAPLVVALHGGGASEASMIGLAPWLPPGPVAYAAVRGPVEQGSGFTWPIETARRWFLDWLDTEGDPERPVILLGFADGATFAAALLLAEPHRWAAGVLLHGSLPADAPRTPGRLVGIPLFLCHDDDAAVAYLVQDSGAPVRVEREPGGDRLAGRIVGETGSWLTERLHYLRRHGENPLADDDAPDWPTLPDGLLPARNGAADPALREPLHARLLALPGVTAGPDGAFHLDRTDPDAALLDPAGGEFARLHPDGTLHLVLPTALAYHVVTAGRARAHPDAGVRLSPGAVQVPGPADDADLDVVAGIAAAAHHHATTPTPT